MKGLSDASEPTDTWMSMMGFAMRPGTDVEPTCSMRRARSPSAAFNAAASSVKRSAQAGSYGSSVIMRSILDDPHRVAGSRGLVVEIVEVLDDLCFIQPIG